jgi:hypothetical protein
VKVKERKNNNEANWRKKENKNESTLRTYRWKRANKASISQRPCQKKKKQPPRSATVSNINEKAKWAKPTKETL